MASHDDGDLAAIVAMPDPQLFGGDAVSDATAMQSECSGGQDDLALAQWHLFTQESLAELSG